MTVRSAKSATERVWLFRCRGGGAGGRCAPGPTRVAEWQRIWLLSSIRAVEEFDFQRLTQVLASNLERGFATYQERFPGHKLYAFGPYTSGELSYFIPTASSDVGLQQVVQSYRAQSGFTQKSDADLAIALRWSPCDSPLHEAFAFDDELDGIASSLGEHLDAAFDDDDDDGDGDDDYEAFDTLAESAHQAICIAMQSLDARGVFGRGDARPLLNLWKGDQSDEELLALAAALNPPDAVAKFRAELEHPARLS